MKGNKFILEFIFFIPKSFSVSFEVPNETVSVLNLPDFFAAFLLRQSLWSQYTYKHRRAMEAAVFAG